MKKLVADLSLDKDMLKAVIEKNGWSLIGAWKKKYNEERPHRSLGNLTPREFARRIAALRPPTADSAPQFGERNEIEVMSSGDLKVV